MRNLARIAFAAAFAIAVPLGGAQRGFAQTRQQSTCPAHGAHDAAVLRRTLEAATGAPNQAGLDYARLSREQPRALNTPLDQAVCAQLDDVFHIATAEQRLRLRSYFKLGDHYVAVLPRDPKTRPHSEFGSVVFLDRDRKFVVAWTM